VELWWPQALKEISVKAEIHCDLFEALLRRNYLLEERK